SPARTRTRRSSASTRSPVASAPRTRVCTPFSTATGCGRCAQPWKPRAPTRRPAELPRPTSERRSTMTAPAQTRTVTVEDVRQFLYREARYLDDREFERWLECYHPEAEFWMPA